MAGWPALPRRIWNPGSMTEPSASPRVVFLDFDGTYAHQGAVPSAHIEAVRQARDAQPGRAVEREQARRVRALQDRLDAIVLQHAAATPTLDVEALDTAVEVDLADDHGHESVPAGERLRVSVAHDTTVEIPGHARIRIRLHQEALGRAAEIDRLREQLRSTFDELGCAHVDDVEELADATEQANALLREATRDIKALLRPWGAALV